MLRFLLLLAIRASSVAAFGENGQYHLDESNPSFIMRGDEFGTDAIIINTNVTGATLQINGLFTNVANVSLSVVADTQLFTQTNIYSQGPRGLRLIFFPVTINVAESSDKNFWLSFSLTSHNSFNYDIGLDDYVLQTFTPASKITPPYTMRSNATTAALMTIINTQYTKTDCFPFEMTDLKIDTGCNISMYAAIMTTTPSTEPLSYNYYTFQIPANCTVSFRLAESKNITERDYDPGYWTQGFVASCEFPGYGMNQYAPATPVHQLIRARGKSTINIDGKLSGHSNVGNGGNFDASILENGKPVAALNGTGNNNKLKGKGHDLQIDYNPGAAGRTGFLFTYSFGDPDVIYYDLSKDPLIYDTRMHSTKDYMTTCYGSVVQVNANNVTGAGNIFFTDATQTWNIMDVANQARRFTEYVHVATNDNSAYVAAFTCVDKSTDSAGMGLDDYKIYSYQQNTKSTLVIPSKTGAQAVTIAPIVLSTQGVYLARPTINGSSCNVPLYVSGIPSKYRKSTMMLYNFNSSTTDNFVQSGLFSVFTLIVPAGCDFSIDLADKPDDTINSCTFGAHGFVVSKEYPGYKNNYFSAVTSSFSRAFTKNYYLAGGKFTVDIPIVEPGTGLLNITIYNTDMNTNMIFDSYAWDRHFSDKGYMLNIDWKPQFSSSGMLLRWRLDAVKSGSVPCLLVALFVAVYYLWK
ncbi:unnamed protein product, partial [Mesorhabditis spiculigera]